ncbi:acyltransferase [Enterovibrio calviensis]|uniref:acyltransferase n=1 Tax=Enterovibrio calviensis TaxID=91359 RepID=UPI0006860F68|nr:hypothetical protein [Enterovibrio calviensis]
MIIIKFFIDKVSFVISLFYIFKWKLGFNYKDIAISLSLIRGKLGYSVRQKFYEKTLLACGIDLKVHFGAYIVYPETTIGNRCSIEEYSVLSLASVGNDVIIASNVVLLSGSNHHEIDKLDVKFHDSLLVLPGIKLGDNIWIGVNSVIMGDVPSGCVIAAGSVINKNLLVSDAVYGGVPVKLIRKRG